MAGRRVVAEERDDDVLEELRRLRKGPGFTHARLLETTAVITALGGRHEPADTLRTRFGSAVSSLDDPAEVAALNAAFRLTPSLHNVLTLQGRREIFGAQIDRSPDSLRNREDAALTSLALRFLTNYYAGAPVDQRLPVPHGGILLARLAVTTNYHDRRFISQRQERTIIPLVDGATGFRYNSNNDVTRLSELTGATVETNDINGGSAHLLRFTGHPLLGRPYDFGFTEVAVQSSDDTPLPMQDKAGQSFETPTLYYSQEVVFTGPRPETIWWYQNLPLLERPGNPSKAHGLAINDEGSTRHRFSQLYGGLYSGVAWRWVESPDDDPGA